MRTCIVALLVVLSMASRLKAAEPDAPVEYTPSDDLLDLLQATDDDDKPVITPEERAYFDALPVRAKQLFDDAIEYEQLSEADHLAVLLDLKLPAPDIELLMQDYCIVCHSDPWQDSKVVFSPDPEASDTPRHLNLREYTSDVHFRRGVSCAGCHGGDPLDVVMTPPTYKSMPEAPGRHEDRSWIPKFCARCHADPTYMRRFDPSLPTDQYAKYRDSHHGKLLLGEGDSKAAQCVSCHTSHSIRAPDSPRSTVNARNVPGTCGHCHADADYMRGYKDDSGAPLPTNQLAQYKKSVHGRALLEKGDLGAPACNDCHGSHAATPPETSSVAQVCRTCHAGNGELFERSRHKQVWVKKGWSECAECHGTHDVQEADDSMLDDSPSGVCYECHRKYAKENPECERTAKFFRTSISSLADGTEAIRARVEPLAEKGLDVEPIEADVQELKDILMQERSGIHSFDHSEFEGIHERGRKALAVGRERIAAAEAEYRFRRNGLLVAVGLMILLAVLMGLKIRALESKD